MIFNKNKVLIIVENLPVPFDTRVWKESCTLKENGYEVFVICPKGKGFEKKYELLNGIHIFRHPMPKEGSKHGGYFVEYFTALFCEFILAIRIYLKHRFNIVQGCNPPDNIFLIALFFRIFGVRYIFDHHDVNPELYYAKFGKKNILYKFQIFLEKMTFKFCDVSMSTNRTYRDIAISRGGMFPENVFVVRNGPDLKKFNPVKPVQEMKHGKKYLVGYVGTMSIQEGLDLLLEVAKHIKDMGRKDIQFTCIGGGPGLSELVEMKKRMGLDDVFNFTGRIPDKDLLEILSTADVCVNPDRPSEMNDMSTMIKIMEYMALGKPIVQFNLKEGKYSAQGASLYVERNDIEEFAEKIIWLLDNPDESKRMGALGRRRIEERLEWKYSAPQLIKAYERVDEIRETQTYAKYIAKQIRSIYYLIRAYIPRRIQIYFRRKLIKYNQKKYLDVWPIDASAMNCMDTFKGWPENKKFAFILTHDVETDKGHQKCLNLAALEEKYGFRSSFNFVPERYNVDPDLRNQLSNEGFEIGIHGLNHDGRLYSSYKEFKKRSTRINEYMKSWKSKGFRSPSMHHNLEWLHELDIEYDSSTFDTDPFEPQPDGVGTIYPFWLSGGYGQDGYVELPLTLPQDLTLFVLMRETTLDIWKEKLDWIVQHGGMALVTTHPDYMNFSDEKHGVEEYPVKYYEQFLKYIKEKYEDQYWHVLPKEIARFWASEVMKEN